MLDFRGKGAGKAFEELILERLKSEKQRGNCDIGRYGVQVGYRGEEIIPLHSLPDFEGDLPPDAHHVIFDAKVMSGASFEMSRMRWSTEKANPRRRQLRHMLDRSKVGATCFFLIHMNSRELKKRSDPTETIALPVRHSMPFWTQFEEGEFSNASRDVLRDIGIPVTWNTITTRETKFRPDVLSAIYRLRYRRNEQSRFVYDGWSEA